KTGLGYDGQMNKSDLNDIHVNESEVLNNVVDSRESDGDDSQESDSKDENVFKPKEVKKTVKPILEKIEFVNARNTTVEMKKAEKPRKFSQNPRGNKKNWNGLMTQKLGDGFEFKKKACLIPFPPLPPILSPPSPVLSPTPPPSPICSLGYRAAMIRLRAKAASTSHSPPLQLPSASHREDRPEVTLPPRKKLGIALGPGYEVGESSSAAAARLAGELLRADHRRYIEIIELRIALQGQVTTLQGQVTASQAQVTALQGQQGLARGPTQLELPEEAGSGS
nr:retrotransposon Orf1 [Tanacetum cinerariifolium]